MLLSGLTVAGSALTGSRDLDPSFVHEGGGLEGLAGAFVGHFLGGETA